MPLLYLNDVSNVFRHGKDVFRTPPNIFDRTYSKKSQRRKVINYFRKKFHHRCIYKDVFNYDSEKILLSFSLRPATLLKKSLWHLFYRTPPENFLHTYYQRVPGFWKFFTSKIVFPKVIYFKRSIIETITKTYLSYKNGCFMT